MFRKKHQPTTSWFIKVFVIAIFTSLVIFSVVWMNDLSVNSADFVSFITAANILVAGQGKEIYNTLSYPGHQELTKLATGGTLLVFKNAPPLALFFVPLTFLPLISAYRIFVFFNLIMLILAGRLFHKNFKIDKDLARFYVFSYWPVIISIVIGQISILILILTIYIYQSFIEKKYFLVGLLSSLYFNKPQYLLFTPFLLVMSKDKQKYLKGFFFGITILLLFSFLITGRNFFPDYLKFLLNTEKPEYGSFPASYLSFSSMLIVLTPTISNVGIYFINLAFYFFAFLYFVKLKPENNHKYLFVCALLITMAFSIHLWEHDLVLLLIPFYLVVSELKNKLDRVKRYLFWAFIVFIYSAYLFRFITYPFVVSFIMLVFALFFLKSSKHKLRVKDN